ncbi:hypothetical protein ACFKHW_31955 [Bradyrhizobium lupini]|uniref:hypothetical protein n=1 Tax=Rhizobium lupini TaxID=136996 RepID=UPI00366CA08A
MLIFYWRLFMPGMNPACPARTGDSKGKEVLVRPQEAQRPRLGPLPARGAKPHSLRLTKFGPLAQEQSGTPRGPTLYPVVPTLTKPDSNREQAVTIPLCSFSECMHERFEVPGNYLRLLSIMKT